MAPIDPEHTVDPHSKAYWLQKRGNAPAEYEDAFGIARSGASTDALLCAVADGATEASFSRQWARALARAWCHGALRAATFVADLAALRAEWQAAFAAHVGTRQLPWYVAQKAELGAFAAFVGLELHGPAEGATAGRWSATAVGDSNLFVVRGDRLHRAFPLRRADEFTNAPFLVGSRAADADEALSRRVEQAAGDAQPGDAFHLMSDALACWFLRAVEAGELPWRTLEALPEARPEDEPGQGAFAALIAGLREAGELHNDDVTYVRVGIAAAESAAGVLAAAPVRYWLQADETTPF